LGDSALAKQTSRPLQRLHAPLHAALSQAEAQRRLISWRPDRGFGFVRRAHGEDVFLSARDAFYSGLNADDLQVGTRLSFVPWPDEKPGRADRAIHIKIINEAPV
jgi:hypothetical protein